MKKNILALAFFAISNLHAQTIINVTNTVTNASPTPFGLNWAEGNAGRNLNALNNQLGDSGFGRQIIRMKGTADGGSTTYLDHEQGTTNDFYETLFTGMFDGGEIRVYRESATGITLVRTSAVINFLADNLAPNRHRITFAAGAAVQAGDIYVVTKEANADLNQFCHPRLTWIRDGQNTWDKVYDQWSGSANPSAVTKELTTDVPPNGGTTSCKITNTDAGNLGVGIGQYFSNSPLSGEFSFDPAKTYRFSVWLKQTGIANGSVNLNSSTTNINHNFTVTNAWQQYTYDVSGIVPGSENSPVDFLRLVFNGAGTLWVDNFLMYDASQAPFAMKPQIVQQIQNFKPYSLRIWSGQTNGELGTNIGDWTDTELQSSRLWSVNQGPVTGASLKLPTILPLCEANNIAPYLICNPSFSEADFLGLMEYLSGATTTPLGAKRAAQGHPAPYNFQKIYLELGNETWNGLFDPWTYDFNGGRYGKFAQYFYNIVKTSPYYDAAKFELLLGGFFVQPDQYGYGQSAVKTAPDGKQMMLANYIGGFDGLNIPASPTFADSIQQTAFYARWITRNIIDEHIATRNQMSAAGNPYQLGIYEAGPGYALPNPGTPYDLKAEAIGKSLASAVANLDAFLYQSEKGFGLQNLFLFAPGFNWTSHTSYSQGYRPHNHFLAMQMRNNYAKGQMITTNIANNPTTFLPLIDDNNNGVYDGGYGEAPAGNLENIASYAFKDNGNYSVFVLNRNTSQSTPITLNLPAGTNATNAKLYKLTGDPTGNNIDALNYSIQETNLTGTFTGNSYSFTMPPGSIYLFNTASGPLSVSWAELFSAYPKGNEGIVLDWGVTAELNNDRYEVQRAADGINFEKIGTIKGYGTTNQLQRYQMLDKNPHNGINYYRIKQIDNDGKADFSKILTVDWEAQTLEIYPNPTEGIVKIFAKQANLNRQVSVANQLGQEVFVGTLPSDDTLDLSALPRGIYFLRIGREHYKVVIEK